MKKIEISLQFSGFQVSPPPPSVLHSKSELDFPGIKPNGGVSVWAALKDDRRCSDLRCGGVLLMR